MNVRIIKNEQDHEQAMAGLAALMSRDPKPGSKEENELELLALVIRDYERQTVPAAKVDPIESILFRMDQMQLSRKDLVPYISLPQTSWRLMCLPIEGIGIAFPQTAWTVGSANGLPILSVFGLRDMLDSVINE